MIRYFFLMFCFPLTFYSPFLSLLTIWNSSWIHVSSLCLGHANLCNLLYVLLRWASALFLKAQGCAVFFHPMRENSVGTCVNYCDIILYKMESTVWFQIHIDSFSFNTFYSGKMEFMHELLSATRNDIFTHANFFWQMPKPPLPCVNWWTFSQSAFFLCECQAWVVVACFPRVPHCSGFGHGSKF